MSRIDEAIQAKRQKRAELEAKGVLAHPYSFAKTHTIAQARVVMGEVVQTAGRIMAERTHGKVTFFDLKDATSHIQIVTRLDELSADQRDLLPLIDRGDFVGVSGTVMTTKTGEVSIAATNLTFLGKALRPIPTTFTAAEDKETRFRKRYLDMLINPEVKHILDARWLIEKEVRRYLQDQHDFVEVETPVFHPLYGGTNAQPFTTHMNALDVGFYLRLAPELYLKRLIVGGYDRIFEIARNFRNEGIDQTHQPEFTMIEWYETYGDYHRMMDVAEGLFRHLISKLHQTPVIQVGETSIDLSGAWPRLTMTDALKQHTGIEFAKNSDTQLQSHLTKHSIELIGEFTRGKALFALFDKLVTPKLISPIWIIDYPRDVSPLSKQHRLQPEFAERFELYIGGKELADGWSEITDPIDQRNIFENEQKRMRSGDTEAHPLDEDFLEAMEYGLPPLCGIGLGIDRLVMFLTNTWSIKEVIAFPTLRPLQKNRPFIDEVPRPQLVTAGQVPTKAQGQPVNTSETTPMTSAPVSLPSRTTTEALLTSHIKNERLLHHCRMVAKAMAAYAQTLGEDADLWYTTGLLHDLDWEEYPDEHPNKAIAEWLGEYPQALRDAIAAHAPDRTGKHASTKIEQYLFACDELSGFLHALSLLRPNGFADMEVKSVKKKLKDKAFAANVSRADITQGAALINTELEKHIDFLIQVFQK